MAPAVNAREHANLTSVLLIGLADELCSRFRDIATASGRITVLGQTNSYDIGLAKILELEPDVILLEAPQALESIDPSLAEIMALKPSVVLLRHPHLPPNQYYRILHQGAVACFDQASLTLSADTTAFKQLVLLLVAAAGMQTSIPAPRIPLTHQAQSTSTASNIVLFCEECGTRNVFQPSQVNDRANLSCKGCGDRLVHALAPPYRKASFLSVIGAGAGSIRNLLQIIPRLPGNLSGAILCVVDEAPEWLSHLSAYLAKISAIPVSQLTEGDSVEGGKCYLVAASHRLALNPQSTRHTMGASEQGNQRSPFDLAFDSVASVFKQNCAGLILSGANSDGVQGMQQIKAAGGRCAVLFTPHCLHREAGRQALQNCAVDKVVDEPSVAEFLTQLHEEARRGISTA